MQQSHREIKDSCRGNHGHFKSFAVCQGVPALGFGAVRGGVLRASLNAGGTTHARLALSGLGFAVLTGCASVSLDQNISRVNDEASAFTEGIGVDHTGLARKVNKLIPDYMVMGERGMADMAEMEMPIPDNTVPMMTGQGPFGSVEMGGMFSVLKVRRDQQPGDYKDPGWFKHPAGTVAHEYTGPLAEPARFSAEGGQSMPRERKPATPTEVKVRKPTSHGAH